MKRKIFRILSAVLSLILLPILPGVAEQLLPETEEPLVQKMPMDKSSTDDGMDVYADAAEVQPNDAGNVSLLESDDSKGMETKDIVSDIAIPSELQLGVKEKFVIDAKGATFKTSKKSVATVSKKGVVTGKKKGTAKITVKKGGNLIATCVVTVLAAPKKITLSQKKLTLKTGDNITLTVKLPKKTASRINWSSNDSNVAEVDDTGTVIGVGLGSAKITARTFNGKKATCVVTVKAKNPPLSLSFPMKDLSIGLKESVTVFPVMDEGAEAALTWSSKSKKIATVSQKGVITGKKTGSTIITVKTPNGLKATLTVKVLKAPKKVTLDQTEAAIEAGSTLKLTATLPAKTASRITWSSDIPEVATVDESGMVTGVSLGRATITARTFNEKVATCVVTVTEEEASEDDPTGEEPSELIILDDFIIEGGVVTKYIGPGGDVVIPTVDEYGNAITGIGDKAFYECVKVTNVVFHDGLTMLGDKAFYGCKGLVSVSIPDSITSIGKGVFSFCYSLKSISIPNSITEIKDSAFSACHSLESVIIPDSVTRIGGYAFQGCNTLSNVSLPDGVVSIGIWAFNGCSSLKHIDIPRGIDTIEKGVFCSCGLSSVSLPEGITAIGESAFASCISLSSVAIPDSVDTIGEEAFSRCSALAMIEIPKSVRTIGKKAFWYCTALKSITIPGNVTTIDKLSFAYCNSLTEAVFSNGVKSIGEEMFFCCPNLQIVSIPDSVTEIELGAFYSCTGLKSIRIPDSVTSVGGSTFWYCSALTDVKLSKNLGKLSYQMFMDCNELTSIVIPESVHTIEFNAFRDCGALTSVNIPKSVTSIGYDAFRGCYSLKSVTLPYHVASMGDGVFKGCGRITVRVYSGSYAEQWCKDNNVQYSVISPVDARYNGWGKSAGTIKPVEYALLCSYCNIASEKGNAGDMKDYFYSRLAEFPEGHPLHADADPAKCAIGKDRIVAYKDSTGMDAVVIQVDSNNAIVVFAGTHDFEDKVQDAMLFIDSTPGLQLLAVPVQWLTTGQPEVANQLVGSLISQGYRNLYVAGHSLGGHLAVDVTLQNDRVSECFAFDAPGRGDAWYKQFFADSQARKITVYCNTGSKVSAVGMQIGTVIKLNVRENGSGLMVNHGIEEMIDALGGRSSI